METTYIYIHIGGESQPTIVGAMNYKEPLCTAASVSDFHVLYCMHVVCVAKIRYNSFWRFINLISLGIQPTIFFPVIARPCGFHSKS
jgi:hypothetical protein